MLKCEPKMRCTSPLFKRCIEKNKYKLVPDQQYNPLLKKTATSMNLEQLHLAYRLDHDRILLRMSFSPAEASGEENEEGEQVQKNESDVLKQEIRIFITRRLLKNLWPVMMQALATQVSLDRPEAAFASQDLVQMAHHESVNAIKESGSFNTPYTDEERSSPLGEEPILLESIKFHLNVNQPLHMQLIPFNGNGGNIDMHFPSSILHGFCKLLQDAEQEAQWDLQLSLPSSSIEHSGSGLLN